MESDKDESTKEEIYSCIKCNNPLSSSLSIRKTQNNYDDFLKTINESFNNKNYKCIFIVPKDSINKEIGEKFNYLINFKGEKILCKKDDAVVGIIKTIKDEDILGYEVVVGYLNMKSVEVTKVSFKLKKEIPLYSQEQYTVLAKLKQLRYYVKIINPVLKNSIERIKDEQKNIYEVEDKFEKLKLNQVINKFKELEKDINNNNENNDDK